MRKEDKDTYTFTKKWVHRLMWCFVIWISLTYVLAFCGKEQIAESLSQTVMTGGVAIFGGYMLKAYFGTYSKENLRYKEKVMKLKKTYQIKSEEESEGAENE